MPSFLLAGLNVIRPPEPGTVVEEYEGGDAAALAAGYHEGATWYVKFIKV